MNRPNSVNGADPTSVTDVGRRPGDKRGKGGEEFGSALSAELDRPGRDDKTKASDRRTAEQRASDIAERRVAAGRDAAGRSALQRDAATDRFADDDDRAAATDRARQRRTGADPSAVDRTDSRHAAQRDAAGRARDAAGRADTDRRHADPAADDQAQGRPEADRTDAASPCTPSTETTAGPAQTTNAQAIAEAGAALVGAAQATVAQRTANVPAATAATTPPTNDQAVAPVAGPPVPAGFVPGPDPTNVQAAPGSTPQGATAPHPPVSPELAAQLAQSAETAGPGGTTPNQKTVSTDPTVPAGPAATAEATATATSPAATGTPVIAGPQPTGRTPMTADLGAIAAAATGTTPAPTPAVAPAVVPTVAPTVAPTAAPPSAQPDQAAPVTAGPINPAAAPGMAPDGAINPGALGQAGLAGATGPQATAPAAPAAGTPPPPAAAEPFSPPAAQLAMRIVPLKLDADGVHRLTVHLHPADLGPVQVVAEIRNGDIIVQLSGSTDAGNDALRNALDDLRRELNDAGFRNTSLDLRQGNAQQEQARQQFGANGFPGGGRRNADEEPAGMTAPTIRRAAPGTRLDIQA